MTTYKQLMAQKAALDAQLAEVRVNEVAGVIEQIRNLMVEYNLSLEDIQAKRRRGRPAGSTSGKAVEAKDPLPPKYRDPKSGKTWSGRGRAPA